MQQPELSPQEWPAERKWKAAARARGRYCGDLERAVYERWGEEALEVIGKIWREGAERTFLEQMKTFGIEGNDAAAYATAFVLANSVLGYNMELVEATPTRAVVRYHTCHLFDDPSIGGDLCRKAHFRYEQRACELLNPKLKSTLTKLRTEGDPCCEFVVEMEG